MGQFNNSSRFTIENNILKGKEVTYDNDYANLGKFILDSLKKDLDFVGQVDAVTDEVYTYRKMRERSVRCALWMKSQGLLPGDVVASCCGDHMDFALPCFAALYLGAIFIPWDSKLNAEEFLHVMNMSKPKMLFASEGTAVVIAEVAKKAKLDLKIIVFDRDSGFPEFESVISQPGIDEIDKFKCTTIESLDDIAMLLLSSGTTGPRKGVALSHKALMMLMCQSEALGMVGNVCLAFTPTDWITAIESIMMTVSLKMPRIIIPSFEENSACAIIEKYKVNWIIVTGTVINRLVKFPAVSKYDLSSLTRVVYCGTILSMSSYKALVKLLPDVKIFSAYGLTEACSYVTMQTTESPPNSCGKILENMQLKVIDPNTGLVLGPNQNGEILIKSAFMMSFYYNNSQATADILDDEGWLHSGDLGYFDDDAEIFVIDRLKDIIRCEYYDICPSEIESVILSHPGVKDVAVVGQPREQDDDLLIAFVVRAENSSDGSEKITEEEIMNLVATELPWTIERQFWSGVRFIDHMPKTASNKIQRIKLRNLARSIA